MKLLPAAAVVVISLAGLNSANAANPTTVMGKWVERFSNGKGMVTELSQTSIASYPVDETGKAAGQPNRSPVTYKDLGGNDVAVVFGADGSGILVHREAADAITLDFPGAGAHHLIRLP